MEAERPPGLLGPLEQALMQQRVVLISGTVDDERAATVAASLMTLDAIGDEPIELRLNATSDSLDVAFALMDTIDVLGVQINATVAGTVTGTMVGVLAVCGRRKIGALGGIWLREPRAEYSGTATDIARLSGDLESRLEQFLRRLAEATGRPLEHLEADLQSERHLDAKAALSYGLVDEIITR